MGEAAVQPKLTCVTKRMPHHGRYAGYSALLDHLRADRVISVSSTGVERWVGAATRRLLLGRPPGSDWWGAHSLRAELAAWLDRAPGPRVVHVMYGEDLLGLSSYLPRQDTRLVATFHQPMTRIDALRVPRDVVARLDALIALDEAAAEAWRRRHPDLPVHALRLGVDTSFWTPSAYPRRRSCLVVGSHLRDFEVLQETLPALTEHGVCVDLVGVDPARMQGKLPSGVRVHRGISDEALRQLYRDSGAFLLAMKMASGNNALLQALATACPVICSDLPGARSYVQAAAVRWVPPADPAATTAAVLEVLEDTETSTQRAARGRQAVGAHSLTALAERHWTVYRSLF